MQGGTGKKRERNRGEEWIWRAMLGRSFREEMTWPLFGGDAEAEG